MNGKKQEECWYINDKICRKNDPCRIIWNKNGIKIEELYISDNIYLSRNKRRIEWYHNGKKKDEYNYKSDDKLDKDDGPAVIEYYNSNNEQKRVEIWYSYGIMCRSKTDGPAYTEWNIDGTIKHEIYYEQYDDDEDVLSDTDEEYSDKDYK